MLPSTISWATAAPAVAAAFLASLVEVVEAFTIVLAVATVRGLRPALTGAVAGLGLLAVLVLTLGPLLDRIPLQALQLVIGVLLLLFGLRWLRKAILRSAGVIALHDETLAFAKESSELRGAAARDERHLDWIAGLAASRQSFWRESKSSSSSSRSAPGEACSGRQRSARSRPVPWFSRSACSCAARCPASPRTR